jgi:hypothetical protein
MADRGGKNAALDREHHLLAVLVYADDDEERDRGRFAVEPHAHHGAVSVALAEFERTLIRARTDEGRERAKVRGVRFGRPLKLSPHQRREAIERDAGDAVMDVARSFGVDRATLYRLRAQASPDIKHT